MFSFNLNLLSKHRQALMGLATILILMTHAPAYGVVLPFHLNALLSASQIGVLIFFLVSGIGLWYSLNNVFQNKQPLLGWYKKRYIRLFVPYLIIYGPYCALNCVQNNYGVSTFLFDISTISFWFGHKTCWFVNILVPLYLISPLWYKLLDKIKLSIIPTIVVLGLTIATGNGYWIQASAFFAGFWLAKYIKADYSLNTKALVIVIAILTIALALYYLWGVGYLLLILLTPVVLVFCAVIDKIKTKCIHGILNFFGEISLESYLLNTTLIAWINYFALIPDNLYRYRYGFIVVFGVLLSYLIHRICKPLIAKLS